MDGTTAPEDQARPPTENMEAAVVEGQADAKDLLIAALTAERDGLKDQLLRAMAEAQNVQRRLRQQAEEDRKFAAQPLVERLLPVLDSFERSLVAADQGSSYEALLEGVKAVDRMLRQVLESAAVKRIPAVGTAYDPEVHEAVLTLPTDDHPEDTVTDEFEAGYTLHGRVVRPAKVRVAKKP